MFPQFYFPERYFNQRYWPENQSGGLGWYVQLTGMTVSTPLPIPRGARWALCQAETQNVRWRQDGGDPTGAIGMQLVAGNDPTQFGGNLGMLRFFEDASGAILNVTFQ